MSTTGSAEAAGKGDGDKDLMLAILKSTKGQVDCQGIADIMGLPTVAAAQKRLKRFCDKQEPAIVCVGTTIGPIDTADGTVPAKTPRKKATDQSTTPKTPKTPKSTQGTKRKSIVADEDEANSATEKDAKTNNKEDDTADPETPGPKTPKKRAPAKPKTPKTPKSAKPTASKAKKDVVVVTKPSDATDDDDSEDVKSNDAKEDAKEAPEMRSPAKKVKMNDTVAAAVENIQTRAEEEEI